MRCIVFPALVLYHDYTFDSEHGRTLDGRSCSRGAPITWTQARLLGLRHISVFKIAIIHVYDYLASSSGYSRAMTSSIADMINALLIYGSAKTPSDLCKSCIIISWSFVPKYALLTYGGIAWRMVIAQCWRMASTSTADGRGLAGAKAPPGNRLCLAECMTLVSIVGLNIWSICRARYLEQHQR